MKNIIGKLSHTKNYLLVSYIFVLAIILKYSNSIFGKVESGIQAFMPLFIGIGIAYVFNIPMTGIEKQLKKKLKKGTRALAIMFTYLFVLLIFLVLLSLIVPQLISTVSSLLARSSDFEKVYVDVALFIEGKLGINIPIDMRSLYSTLGSQIQVIVENVLGSVTTVANGSVRMFIALIVSLYLLSEKEKMQLQLKKLLAALVGAAIGNKVLVFFGKVNWIFTKYISGLLVDALIIGALIGGMMAIFRFPYALLVGVITAVFAIIPIFGAILAMLIGAVLILAVSPIKALLFIVAYQVVQQIENSLIYPRVVGSSIGLPGLWTMLSVSIAGTMFGFAGMLIAVPITSIFYMVLSDYANGRIKERGIRIEDKYIEE